jgi:hypothetical protein
MKGDFHVRICERLKLKRFGLLDRSMNPPPAAIPDRCAAMLTPLHSDIS